MIRFNILIPFPLLATLGLLVVAYVVAGITGVTVIAVLGALYAITAR